jgi:hypothetical protein
MGLTPGTAPTPDTQVAVLASDSRSAPALPAGLTPQAARAAALAGSSTVPASVVLASRLTATGRPAPASTGQISAGRANTAPISTGLASTGRNTTGRASTGPSSTVRNSTIQDSTALNTTGRASTGRASMDRNSTGRNSTSLASTDPGRASQASTGPGRLDRLARDRPDLARSRQDKRTRTGRRAPTWRPGSRIPTRAPVPTRPARTRMAPGRLNTAPAVADRCRPDRGGQASRAPTMGRDRQAGQHQGRWAPGQQAQDRWGPDKADARGTGAALASRAVPVATGLDNQDRARTALGIPARPRTGRARARDRAGRAGAGRPLDSTSQATGLAALAVLGARDGSATRRLAAPGQVTGTPGRGIGPAAP